MWSVFLAFPRVPIFEPALQAQTEAQTEVSELSDNASFDTVFGRVIKVSEEKRREFARWGP